MIYHVLVPPRQNLLSVLPSLVRLVRALEKVHNEVVEKGVVEAVVDLSPILGVGECEVKLGGRYMSKNGSKGHDELHTWHAVYAMERGQTACMFILAARLLRRGPDVVSRRRFLRGGALVSPFAMAARASEGER